MRSSSDIVVSRRSKLPITTIFAVLRNVDEYPAFLPWCSSMRRVSDCRTVGSEESEFRVRMGLVLGLFRAEVLSTVRVRPDCHSVTARHDSGPLVGTTISWRVFMQDQTSETDCPEATIEFRACIGGGMLAKAPFVQNYVEQLVHRSVSAFERRTQQVHQSQMHKL